MAFKAPTLEKDFTGTGVVTKLKGNFDAVERALIQIENTLPTIGTTSGTNLMWVEQAVRSHGIIGHLSFIPSFNAEQDFLTVEHGLPDGFSACVMGNKYHQTQEEFSQDLKDVVTADGSYRVALGVRSRGAPAMDMIVELYDTNSVSDLHLYTFDVTRVGNDLHVENLRLVAPIILDRDAFRKVHDFDHALTMAYKGALPAYAGPLPVGIIVPWDCSVEGAFLRLETGPAHTEGLTIELWSGSGTDAFNVLGGNASWGSGQSRTIFEVAGKDEPQLLPAGSYVFPQIVYGEGTTDPQASDLTVTLVTRRIYHEIR